MFLTVSLFFFIIAAWMVHSFIAEYRRADGWPWAGEVPVMLILLMLTCGGVLLLGHFAFF